MFVYVVIAVVVVVDPVLADVSPRSPWKRPPNEATKHILVYILFVTIIPSNNGETDLVYTHARYPSPSQEEFV